MSNHLHLEETLQRDIDLLRKKVLEMAGLGERALKASLQALFERDRRLAYTVILRDQYIDELETEVDRLCLQFLVRQQPVAGPLRLVFATIQINRELERIGDYAESIARQALAVSAFDSQPPSAKFIELGDLSAHMLRDAMQAFVRPDADLAQRTMPIEERANALRNSINADLAEMAREGRLPAAAVTPWMTVARRLERASDQAKNMCEEVLYMCTGEFSKHKGADLFRILFLDMANNCLSQMAEGIANSLGLSRFVFASAGLAPQPVDRRTVEFMASKGLDISRQTSKSLDQIPQWEHHQVIVTLGSHVQEAIPAHPAKMIFFNWPIQDPSTVQGPAETVQAAFESARQALESNLKELVGAISDGPQAEIKS